MYVCECGAMPAALRYVAQLPNRRERRRGRTLQDQPRYPVTQCCGKRPLEVMDVAGGDTLTEAELKRRLDAGELQEINVG